MAHVGVWRSLTLLAVCQLQLSRAAVSIIERDVEPTTLVTSAATTDSEPIWLVLPVLLDVQPVLLKVDVTRHVPAQIQSFCRDHGVDVTRGAGAIREALDEVVNLQKFCKKPTAERALPGFVVTKNALRETAESSASWLQNDPEDVAIDFCSFAQAKAEKTTETKAGECVDALGKALRLSFDWMLALTPCEQEAEGDDGMTASHSEASSLADRLATVEEMIAALQSSSSDESEVASSGTLTEGLSGEIFRDESGTVEEISESEEPTAVVTEDNAIDTLREATAIDNMAGYLLAVEAESIGVNLVEEDVDEVNNQIDDGQDTASIQSAKQDDSSNSGEKTRPESDEEVQEFRAPNNQSKKGEIQFVAAENGSSEAAFTTPQDGEPSRLDEKLESQKTWKVGAALVLTLSILYLAIDLVLHGVHYVAGHLGAPKQLIRVVLHDILVLTGGAPRSTLKDAYSSSSANDDLKKVVPRLPKTLPEECVNQSKREIKQDESETQDDSVKPRSDAHHQSLPTFTCVAMMLIAGSHVPIATDSIALPQNKPTFPTLSFVQDSNAALKYIQDRYERELRAVQRIQKAWKDSQRKSLLKKEWKKTFSAAARDVGKSDKGASILRLLLQLEDTKTAQQKPPANIGTRGLSRLVSSTLPPL